MPVTWSDEKHILLYCPGRGSNSRPSARRSVNMIKVSYALTTSILTTSHGHVKRITVVAQTRDNTHCAGLGYMFPFLPNHVGVPFGTLLCYFLGYLQYLCCSSNMFISDVIILCHSTHPSQYCHVVLF